MFLNSNDVFGMVLSACERLPIMMLEEGVQSIRDIGSFLSKNSCCSSKFS